MDDFVSKPVDRGKLSAALDRTDPGRREAFARRQANDFKEHSAQ
jgi:hypothetical protein